MIPNILQLLAKAVTERRCLAIRYHDQREARVIEPHAVYTGENGEILVDAFQTSGYTSTGRTAPFWRPFRARKIASVSLLNEVFAIRSAYGFTPARRRYQKGLIAIVGAADIARDRRPANVFAVPARQMVYPPIAVGADIGPPLPPTKARR